MHWKILSNIGPRMEIWRAFSRNWTSFIEANENRRALNLIAGRGIRPSHAAPLPNGIWRGSTFDLGDATARWNISARCSALIRNCRSSLRPFWNLRNWNWRNGISMSLALLNEARTLRPDLTVLERVNLLAAQIQYRAKHFEDATVSFEQIGHSDSNLASLAMFNAALSWLQKGDETRFLADAEEFGKK